MHCDVARKNTKRRRFGLTADGCDPDDAKIMSNRRLTRKLFHAKDAGIPGRSAHSRRPTLIEWTPNRRQFSVRSKGGFAMRQQPRHLPKTVRCGEQFIGLCRLSFRRAFFGLEVGLHRGTVTQKRDPWSFWEGRAPARPCCGSTPSTPERRFAALNLVSRNLERRVAHSANDHGQPRASRLQPDRRACGRLRTLRATPQTVDIRAAGH